MNDLEQKIQKVIDRTAIKWPKTNHYDQEWHIEQANFENLMIDIREFVKEREQAAAEKAVREFSDKAKKELERYIFNLPGEYNDYINPIALVSVIDQLLQAELGEGK